MRLYSCSQLAAALATLALASVPASGQEINALSVPDVRTGKAQAAPRTADGKPNLAAPVPTSADGKPDLTGLWMRVPNPNERVTALAMGPNLEDFMRPGEKIPPLLPAAEALHQQRMASFMADRPSAHCLPHSIPDEMLLRNPLKIVQNAGVTFILYEQYTLYRQIFTDGRIHPPVTTPPGSVIPLANGRATGS